MNSDMTFGRRIQELRNEKTWSQRELAKKAGMDYTYLSKIENGKMPPPRPDVISKLAETLGGDVNELLGLAGKLSPALGETMQKSAHAREFICRHAPSLSEDQWKDLLAKFEKDVKN